MQPNPPASATVELIPASQFSVDELTAIYNQTRVDYLIPMPMNAARLAEYIRAYDVDLEHSLIARYENTLQGVAMLALRQGRAWITRLGVLPTNRRLGTGKALMTGLLQQADQLGLGFVMLEVVKNNTPAHELFLKLGFVEVGELLILRRSPVIPPPDPVVASAERLDRSDALNLLSRSRGKQAWTNQTESLRNVQDVSGLYITLPDGSRGWLVYQRQKFTLTRLAYKTEVGDPVEVGYALLTHLHYQYPRLDTNIENIQTNDPHLPAFMKMGYIESFRRIEMWRGTPPDKLDF